MLKQKPELNFWQIWNMCFGFLGIQFGLALQNANVSRIFQTLGASIDDIPILWIAGPLTGLIVQPIVGYYSDRTWNKLGRRRPFFFYGAVLTTLSLFIMPNSSALWIAAGTLWILDASLNIAMEPFRAFVGDMLPNHQRTKGYAMQSFFIAVGAVIASAMPWILTNVFDVSNTAPAGEIPASVTYSFYLGGAVLFAAVMWTVKSTKEYSPEQLEAFEKACQITQQPEVERSVQQFIKGGVIWALAGTLILAFVYSNSLDKELYLLSGGLVVFGLIQIFCAWLRKNTKTSNGFYTVVNDLFAMPEQMRKLAVTQFFSWFAMFAMWIYTTSAVTSYHYQAYDVTSSTYNDGADWVGVLFAAYNVFAVFAAVLIPYLANKLGRQLTHMFNLFCGGAGLILFLWIKDPTLLWIPMIGVGIAWASIVSMPYSLLSSVIPAKKMGVYMGIFNFFIVIPQLLAATVLGFFIRHFFEQQTIYALVIGGVSMIIAGISVLRVKTHEINEVSGEQCA